MSAKYPLLVLTLAILFSCKKVTIDYPPLPNPPTFIDLQLKDITIRNLPSPYYHFEYTSDNHISKYNFSQLWTYEMKYSGDTLDMMKGNALSVNKDSVAYIYSNGAVTNIQVFTDNKVFYRKAALTYYPSGQLHTLEWEVMPNGQPFTKENSLTFSYYNDGNVKDIVQHYWPLAGVPDLTFTDTYSNYDDKGNPEGFTLVHTSQFKHAILLPVIFQISNARRIVRTGGSATNYEVNYTYTFDKYDRPLTKTGDFLETSGPNTGRHTELFTSYSYYY